MAGRVKFVGLALVALALALAGCKPREAGEGRGLRLPQSPLLSALERKSGLIAFSGVDGNIYTVDQAGGNKTQLTQDARLGQGDFIRFYTAPTWSPDSKSLAFYSISGTSQDDIEASVYTMGSDGQNQVEAFTSSSHLPIYLSWSPDSQNLSFITGVAGGEVLALNMVPIGGGQAQVLDTGAPFYWDWQPDGKGMVVHTGGARLENPLAKLALLSLAEGVVEEGLSLKPAFFQSPAFSPNGAQLLLAALTDEGKSGLMLTDRTGNVQSVLSTFEGSVAFSWSPDGKRIAYIASDRLQTVTMGTLNFVHLGDPVKTTAVEHEEVIAFYWSPNGKQVVYFVVGEAPLGTPEAGVSQETQLFLTMYVADAASGKSHLVARFVPTQEFLRTIPYFDQYARSTTIWSPDSKNLVVSAYLPGGDPGIFVVPASGVTNPRFLEAGTLAVWSWK